MAEQAKNNASVRSERPLSPHLTIYKPQITSVLSITHRATGVFLLLGAVLLAVWLIAIAWGPDLYDSIYNFLSSWIGQIILLAWTLSLYFHLLNGIRHLFWDFGQGFELRNVTASGIMVLVGTLFLTAVTWMA